MVVFRACTSLLRGGCLLKHRLVTAVVCYTFALARRRSAKPSLLCRGGLLNLYFLPVRAVTLCRLAPSSIDNLVPSRLGRLTLSRDRLTPSRHGFKHLSCRTCSNVKDSCRLHSRMKVFSARRRFAFASTSCFFVPELGPPRGPMFLLYGGGSRSCCFCALSACAGPATAKRRGVACDADVRSAGSDAS